ncbi:MAG: PDZ domain-containing protein, partial [bacterium]
YYDLNELNGVIIRRVIKDSPAHDAGLMANDIIAKIDEQEINKLEDLQNVIQEKEIGDTIRIEVVRDGMKTLLFAEIGKRPNQTY